MKRGARVLSDALAAARITAAARAGDFLHRLAQRIKSRTWIALLQIFRASIQHPDSNYSASRKLAFNPQTSTVQPRVGWRSAVCCFDALGVYA
ncbi:hypothetical protein KDH83_20450 [Achromobacter sp. Marseille-Q0513]|uniref:hypothetical protein n=1 Tax=Achromobacter sp. Marseille-Q0513 TaxID=2829161 RepID=UPI001B93E5BC|nr:hypothetical protein [Achromobacter sp. Marseille-Q0513]MBR8655680.1 hypothetical protein [Achromobacter sp. Marseille-Q0513]